MAQSARNESTKPSEQAKDRSREGTDHVARLAHEGARNTEDAAEHAADTGGKVLETARHEGERAAAATSQAAKEVTARSAETLRRSGEIANKATNEVLDDNGEILRTLMALASEQFQHNIETARRLAGIRDWSEASEVQHQYVMGSLDRLSAGMERCFELTSGLMGKMIETGREEPRAR